MPRLTYELLDEYHHARLLTVAQIAQELGISRSTVYRHMRRLRVPLRSQRVVPDGVWAPRPPRRRIRPRNP